MPNKPRQKSEMREKHWAKLDRLIQVRFSGSNMSSAKWVKLLRAAAHLSAEVPRMSHELVYGPEVRETYTAQFAESVETEWFREPIIYKEVEWVEFPFSYYVGRGLGVEPLVKQQGIAALRAHLESIGQFPLVETGTGIRVVAYAEA